MGANIIVGFLVLLLLTAVPSWRHSDGWAYGPGSILGLALFIVILLALLGYV